MEHRAGAQSWVRHERLFDSAAFRYNVAVVLLLLAGATALVQVALTNEPFNAFEDDAYWLVPSLAYDIESGAGWQHQISNDKGERGAISLTTLLRGLYILFGSNPTYYIIIAILLHTVCSFVLLIAMRECGTERWTAFLATAGFLFSSMQFHAYFWVIGVQHVLAVTSILLTFIIVNRFMRLCRSRPMRRPTALQCATALTLLFVLSFNRPSILISLIVIPFLFLYYRLGYSTRGTPDHTRSLLIVYSASMLAAPAYEILQISRNGEGWQIAAFLPFFARLSANSAVGIRFLTLYTGYALLVVVSAVLMESVARHTKHRARFHITEKLYFGSIGLVVLAAVFYEKHYKVLSALSEQMVFVVKDPASLTMRWSIVSTHDFPPHIARTLHVLLYLAWVAIFIYARPRQRKQQVLSAVWLIAIALGLVYVNFLMNAPMFLRGIPSRYVYYFSPAMFMAIALSARRFFSMHFRTIGRVVLLAGCGTFIVLNVPATSARLVNANTAFFNEGDGQFSFDIAESIVTWMRKTGHTGDVRLNATGFRPRQWHPRVEAFIPPTSSEFHPLFFNAQAFLSQMLHERRTRIHVVSGAADLFLCGRKVCETPD